MSQQRFIRCPACGLPHEAELTECPLTGKALTPPKRRRRPSPPPSEEDYSWAHTVRATKASNDGLDPTNLEGFVGRTVEGKYQVEALIGRGGMGAVYRAINLRLGRAVALKVMYKGYSPGSEAERRFTREARTASSLGHPNIVEVFDLGSLVDGKPFQVMELLEGESLGDRIAREGAIGEDEARAIGVEVLSALEAAHGRGVIHRDLKPENVFLAKRGDTQAVKLLDFGVSKSLHDHSLSLTRTGVVVGTPYYLSPEQIQGGHAPSPAIDLWAMGVLLYEALTGVLPFNAQGYEALLAKIRESSPVPPHRFQPRLSVAIENLVLKALARNPSERPRSAAQFRVALEATAEADVLLERFVSFDLEGAGDSTIREELNEPPSSNAVTIRPADDPPSEDR